MGSRSGRRSPAPILVVLVSLYSLFNAAWAAPIGICYGTDGDNLPTPTQAVALLTGIGVTSTRIFDSNPQDIQAFADSGIDLGITVPNSDVVGIALNQNASDQWLAQNVLPYVPATNISFISVGSEVIYSDSGNISSFLVPAMINMYNSLRANNLASSIKVSTSNAMNVLSSSFPPSAGAFNSSIVPTVISPLLSFLSQTRAPFLLNSYPYYAYENDPNGVPLAYALFSPSNPVTDSNNNLLYTNLFDAQIDAVYAAMNAVNFTDITIVVAESGWPTKGDANEIAASASNAQTYNQNLINHIIGGSGTPLKPGVTIQTYIFSLYDEDLKPGPTSERNFGVYSADGTAVYSLNFGGSGNPQAQRNRTWCIADSNASNASLAIGLNFACGQGRVDCDPIRRGGACYEPNTFFNHASYAFNDYYQTSNMDSRACNFSNTATLTNRDPSYDSCEFYAKNPNSALSMRRQGFYLEGLSVLLSIFLLLKLRD